MKRYIKAASSQTDWQSHLPEDVLTRLSECTSRKRDIVPLTRAYYNYSHEVSEQGLSLEDCLQHILEWVLDWNGATWDYTDKEYDRWLSQI